MKHEDNVKKEKKLKEESDFRNERDVVFLQRFGPARIADFFLIFGGKGGTLQRDAEKRRGRESFWSF